MPDGIQPAVREGSRFQLNLQRGRGASKWFLAEPHGFRRGIGRGWRQRLSWSYVVTGFSPGMTRWVVKCLATGKKATGRLETHNEMTQGRNREENARQNKKISTSGSCPAGVPWTLGLKTPGHKQKHWLTGRMRRWRTQSRFVEGWDMGGRSCLGGRELVKVAKKHREGG